MTTESSQSIFREEALAHHRNRAGEGHVLRITSHWAEWGYFLVFGSALAAFLFVCLASVNEYATGSAVVHIDGRTEVTAAVASTVAELAVRSGTLVHRGDRLARFYVAAEEAEQNRVIAESENLLVRLLQNPADLPAREALGQLTAQRALADAKLADRWVVAKQDGIVGDVRIRLGQAVQPGDTLLTVTAESAMGTVIALVPAQYRPMLAIGMKMRLEPAGFRFAYHEMEVREVGDEAMGPKEAKRLLGAGHEDTIEFAGPVVVVLASLPSREFVSAGRPFRFYDGMVGKVDLRVRRESLLVALLPGLHDLWRGFSVQP